MAHTTPPVLRNAVDTTTKRAVAASPAELNETASPPADNPTPWVTTAVRNVSTTGAEMALERAEVASGSIGDERDIERIEAEALAAQDDTTFRVAVLALKLMSVDQANDAIRRILDAVDEHRRSTVEDPIE